MNIAKIYCWIIGVLSIIAADGIVRGQPGKEPVDSPSIRKPRPITCSLLCSITNGHVWANVVFSNATDSSIEIWKRNILREETLSWQPFEVRRNGKWVTYTGVLGSRSPPKADEFYAMPRGGISRATIDLSEYYNLSKSGNYTVKYVSINLAPPNTEQNVFYVESGLVNFKK